MGKRERDGREGEGWQRGREREIAAIASTSATATADDTWFSLLLLSCYILLAAA